MRVSEYYKIGRTQPYLDFVDITLHTDVSVFVDPTAIKSLESNWGHELIALLQGFFDSVLQLIKNGNHKSARRLLASLNESNEFHLGLSEGESKGHAFGDASAESVWDALTNSEASLTGLLQDLEDTCLLIKGIGPDMISDAVCNILRGPLIKYTQDMCIYYGIPMAESVPSGAIWNPVEEKWDNDFVALPVTDCGKIILVPKVLVRHKVCYKPEEYYRHYLLPQMQRDEIENGSSLVHALKGGRKRVTKKSLMEKYGSDKLAVVTETLKRPQILDQYRNSKKTHAPLPLSHDDISAIEEVDKPDWSGLLNQLDTIKTGREQANDYEDLIEKILSSLFYPSLCYPTKQHEIHDGRKRIDITYTNEARNGFFYWASMHYPCSQIFVECKNYGKDVENPELDQLSGRFSPSRGQVGILVCREVSNKDLLQKRCIDTAKDMRGFVIPLDDEDLRYLIAERIKYPESNEYSHLRELFNALIA